VYLPRGRPGGVADRDWECLLIPSLMGSLERDCAGLRGKSLG
jgi:hypothetical protein